MEKIKSLIYAAKMMVKYKKILFLLYSARTIIQLANAYIFIFFPSMLITNLQSGSYFAAAMVVLGFVGLQMDYFYYKHDSSSTELKSLKASMIIR